MTDENFNEKPTSYVKFKWKGQSMEGEFFQDSISLIDDQQTVKGYIRPFDKDLRQSIVDIHQYGHKIDYNDFCSVGDLIECDSLITDAGLKRPYLDVLVTDFEFIEEKDLTTEIEQISSCRADVLRRQYILAKALNEPADISKKLEQEFKKWVMPNFEPLRYKRTKFTKIKQSSIVQFLGIILFLFIVMKLSK